MGPLLFPVLAFVLWELPSMVFMSLHKMACALTGRSFQEQFQGVWAYRLLGMITVWPTILVTGGLAAGDGMLGGFFRFLLGIEILGALVLMAWARTSSRGA
jgi:hypothetical protein